jgi:RNA polymerase sigma factor (sigma-70 family)
MELNKINITMKYIDEKYLIDKLKKKDEDSYRLFFDVYGTKIFNLAYKLSGNKDDAKDITQEVFIQISLSIHKFRGECQISTWLYSITKNISLRFLQNRKNSSFTGLEKIINVAQDKEANQNISKIEKDFYIQQIREGCLIGLLRCLSFYQRISFILHIILDVKINEVAKIIDKSEGMVRVLIHRAKNNIRNFLCKNCSLYNESNFCNCENLIGFSLKQGWIKKPSGKSIKKYSIPAPDEIERNIKVLEKITIQYMNLPEHEVSNVLKRKIFDDEKLLIFKRKKV